MMPTGRGTQSGRKQLQQSNGSTTRYMYSSH